METLHATHPASPETFPQGNRGSQGFPGSDEGPLQG